MAEELELRFYEELEDWEIFVATREVVRPALELLLIEEIPHRRWSLLNLILAGLDDAACEQVGGLEDVWDQLMTETGREIENALATFLAEDQRNPKFNTRLRDFVRTRMGGEQPQADWLSSKPANLIIALLDLPDSERAVVLGDLLANCDWEHMVALIGVIKCTGPTAQNLLAVLEHCHNPSYFWAVVDELRVRGLDPTAVRIVCESKNAFIENRRYQRLLLEIREDWSNDLLLENVDALAPSVWCHHGILNPEFTLRMQEVWRRLLSDSDALTLELRCLNTLIHAAIHNGLQLPEERLTRALELGEFSIAYKALRKGVELSELPDMPEGCSKSQRKFKRLLIEQFRDGETMPKHDHIAAHVHSRFHRSELESSDLCGCFCCLAIFPPEQIHAWLEDEGTALCPHCSIDSVIGDSSGFEVSQDLLSRMKAHWFGSE